MSDRLKKTFDYLDRSANPYAVEVLIHALDVRSETIRNRAAASLCRRNDPKVHAELMRRYDGLSPAQQELIGRASPRFTTAIREALQGDDAPQQTAVVKFLDAVGGIEHAGELAGLIESPEWGRTAARILRSAVDRCCERPEELSGMQSQSAESRERRQDRRRMFQMLLKSLPQVAGRATVNDVMTMVLSLSEPTDPEVWKLLASPDEPAASAGWTVLRESVEPLVARFVARALGSQSLADRIVDVVLERDDAKFVEHFLRALPELATPAMQSALKQFGHLKWFGPGEVDFDWIPGELQGKLVGFLAATALKEDRKLDLYKWMLHHGSLEGRTAAADLLAELDEELVESAINDGLDSDDVTIEAWAISLLRNFEVPEAFSHLISRLDSPSEEVRRAARQELADFNLPTLLSQLNGMSPVACRNAGELIRKVDDDWKAALLRELHGPVRQKRVHALRASQAFGLHEHIVLELLELLNDEDVIVRRTAIDAVSDLPYREVAEALGRLLDDVSPRIRNAAQSALSINERACSAQERKTAEPRN